MIKLHCTKVGLKPMWMLVLLIYTKVSEGEFYDSNHNVRSNLDDGGINLHSFVPSSDHTTNGDVNEANKNYDNSLRLAEINFLAKLAQRYRQRQPDPVVGIAMEKHNRDQSSSLSTDVNSIDGGVQDMGSFDNDLRTLVKYLIRHREELTGEHEPNELSEEFSANGQKRAAALRATMARRSHSFTPHDKERFSPSISVGSLTNLGDFFHTLKHNLESLETRNLSNDQVKLLQGQNMISNLRKEFIEDFPKPAGSAAFLHAIRNYRPSHRIRALVSSVPDLYRGTNFHDPVYKLAGLGK
ncbi:uncharacterized protein LOC129770016 isoform X2 [Toxorhynchites rutilus septentrionalis]|uniref:uncharacterized protein LOC129770016 isoform X2 n=1 Tax=Toxorhynchites rutilus septentrionalis TaxID=329112 RepID=UPI002479BE6A|nr:uncharacterized protein LOC129770016 isoform X2 [Toxorhynchites rutilus septentrionalis]